MYMFLEGLPLWALRLIQKNNLYNTRTLWLDIDYECGEMLVKRAEDINHHIAAGSLPERTADLRLCTGCDFSHICTPDIQGGEGVMILNNDDIEAALTRMRELETAHSEYETCKKAVDTAKAFLPDASAETYQQVKILQAGEHLITYTGSKKTTQPTRGGTSYFWRHNSASE
jgi:hypothetical protein